jgi:hypothetical protein
MGFIKMNTQAKWGVGIIVLGLLVFALIDVIFTPETEEDMEGINFLRVIYSFPLIVFGIAIILFGKREEKIEQVKEEENESNNN